ncbi:ATP-binding cassette domain-containing protein [Lactococcus nasutitermitis]|uniref:ATP-binding cassette domain-containing protein n=1 Tax=Lactococcus nasutitermitis TaxID=1652957 RepID=A0ABV9JAK5_9LACT|nr:ABC transporter ATP-binding protein [Lactococcus nasutitermitis]
MKQFFVHRKIEIIKVTFFSIILAAAIVGNSIILRIVVNATKVDNVQKYLFLSFDVFIFFLVEALVYYHQQSSIKILSLQLGYDVREQLAVRISKLPPYLLEEKKSEKYLTLLTTQNDLLIDSYFYKIFWGGYLLIQFIFAVLVSFAVNFLLSIFVVLLIVPQLIIPFIGKIKLENNKNLVLQNNENYMKEGQEFLEGEKIWKNFAQEKRFIAKFHDSNYRLLENQIHEKRFSYKIITLNDLFSNLLYFGIWVIGGYFIIIAHLTMGELVAFTQLVVAISFPMYSATSIITDFLGGRKVAQKFKNEIEFSENAEEIKKASQDIAAYLTDITVKFSNKTLFEHFSFKFEKSKRYLIIGESGHGKTTLFKLIFDEIKNEKGSVEIGTNIGYVPQQSYVFQGTLEQNITLFASEIDFEKLSQAIKISELTIKRDVQVGNNTLSGGEKQRLSLARALYADYDYLFIDELTSSLDQNSRQKIEENLLNIKVNFAYISHHYNQKLSSKFDEIIEL